MPLNRGTSNVSFWDQSDASDDFYLIKAQDLSPCLGTLNSTPHQILVFNFASYSRFRTLDVTLIRGMLYHGLVVD
jgi:hypothetical protein